MDGNSLGPLELPECQSSTEQKATLKRDPDVHAIKAKRKVRTLCNPVAQT